MKGFFSIVLTLAVMVLGVFGCTSIAGVGRVHSYATGTAYLNGLIVTYQYAQTGIWCLFAAFVGVVLLIVINRK